MKLDELKHKINKGIDIFDEHGRVRNSIDIINLKSSFKHHEYQDSTWSLFGGTRYFIRKVTIDQSLYLTFIDKTLKITYKASTCMFEIRRLFDYGDFCFLNYTSEALERDGEFLYIHDYFNKFKEQIKFKI